MTEFLKYECTPSNTAEQQHKNETVEVMVRFVNKKWKTEQLEVTVYICHSGIVKHVKQKPNKG